MIFLNFTFYLIQEQGLLSYLEKITLFTIYGNLNYRIWYISKMSFYNTL